jgi:hypothetical protein
MKSTGGDERREYFRIKDRLLVEFREVNRDESLSLESNLTHGFSLHYPYRHVLSDVQNLPPFARELYSYLEVIERKLDTIINLLSKEDKVFQGRYLEVDISGAGIRFQSDTALNEGGYVELRIALPCLSDGRITALGKVVRAQKGRNDTKDVWEVAVNFIGMRESEKDMLINYIFSKERERLRVGKTP